MVRVDKNFMNGNVAEKTETMMLICQQLVFDGVNQVQHSQAGCVIMSLGKLANKFAFWDKIMVSFLILID